MQNDRDRFQCYILLLQLYQKSPTMLLPPLLLLILSAKLSSSYNAYSTTFPNLIETGQKLLGTNGITCPKNFVIPFRTAKSTASYDQTLSIQDLYLLHYSEGFSITLGLVDARTTYMTFGVGRCTTYLRLLRVRYLIVLPLISSVVDILHLNRDYSPAQTILQGVSFITIQYSGLSVVASQTSTSIILKGFTVNTTSPHSIHFLVSYELQNTNLKVYIKGIAVACTVSHLSFSAILINNNNPINSIAGSFQVYSSRNTNTVPVITVSDSMNLFSSQNTFLGISSFKYVINKPGLNFRLRISSSSIQFSTSFNIAYDIAIINFVYVVCNLTDPLYFPDNNTCYSSCPSPSQGSSANPYLCSICSSNCNSCVSPTNCTTCADGYYNSSWACNPCNVGCATCTAASGCSTCADRYYPQVSDCILNCSLLDQCNDCNMADNNIFCTNCSQGYNASEGLCSTICGDGLLLDSQICDDNNTNGGDGSSNDCQIEDYFNCTIVNNTGNPNTSHSECSLFNATLQYLYALKDETSNTFIAYLSVQPAHQYLPSIDWKSGLSFSQGITITSVSVDQNGKMMVQAEYSFDITDEITLYANYSNMGSYAKLSPSQSLSQKIAAENNLSLKIYSQNTYMLAAAVKYLCIIISALALLLLLGGYFGGKLIALEHIAVLQIVALSMVSVHDASPTFSGLRSLRLSLGIIPLLPYDYSSSASRELKGSLYTPNALININFGLLFILLPPFAALICKILSKTVCKQSESLVKLWHILLCEITLYGLLFCSYAACSQFIFNISTLIEAKGADDGATMGIVCMTLFVLLMLAYCVLLHKLPRYFGDFKKKFEKYNFNSQFYSIVIIERLLSSIMIIMLRNVQSGLIVGLLIIGGHFAFVAIRNPYILGDYRRPLINLAVAAVCITLILLSNLLASIELIVLYVPVLICLLLAILSCYNTYLFVQALRELYSSQDQNKVVKNKQINFDSIIRYQEPEEIEQKNRFQLEGFRRQLFDDHEEALFSTKQGKSDLITIKQNLPEEWTNCQTPELLEQIKEKQIPAIEEEDNQ